MTAATRHALRAIGVNVRSRETLRALRSVRALNDSQHLLRPSDLAHAFRMYDLRAELHKVRTDRAMRIIDGLIA